MRERALLSDKAGNAVLAFGMALFRGDSVRDAIVVGATQFAVEHDPYTATCMRCGTGIVRSGAPTEDTTCTHDLDGITCGYKVSANAFRAVPAHAVQQAIAGVLETIVPSKVDAP